MGSYQQDSVGPVMIQLSGYLAAASAPGSGMYSVNGGTGAGWSSAFARALTGVETRGASAAVAPVVLI